MIKFDVFNRFSGKVQFTAEIDCAEDDLNSVKLGLAVKWAVKAGANLTGANLAGANLTDTNLTDANLAGSNLARSNLTRSNLTRSNLTDANLARSNLAGARGLDGYVQFGPVGEERRIGWVQIIDGRPVVRLGCFTGSLPEAQSAITEKYGENSTYQALVEAAHAECVRQAGQPAEDAA